MTTRMREQGRASYLPFVDIFGVPMFVIFIVLRRHSGKGNRCESEAESGDRNEGFADVMPGEKQV